MHGMAVSSPYSFSESDALGEYERMGIVDIYDFAATYTFEQSYKQGFENHKSIKEDYFNRVVEYLQAKKVEGLLDNLS